MLHVTMILSDAILIATMRVNNRWDVDCTDSLTGKYERSTWTNAQMAAVLALSMGVGEDKEPGYDLAELNRVAQAAMVNWDPKVRLIP